MNEIESAVRKCGANEKTSPCGEESEDASGECKIRGKETLVLLVSQRAGVTVIHTKPFE